MKIEYMREFVDLASTRSFSRTAERLFVSQPTLSKHVKSMEDELRMPLIDRSIHGVELTDAGRYVVGEFRRILETYSGIESRLDDIRSGFTGTLRLGLLYYATDPIFVPILRRFRKLYPNVSVKTVAGQPDQVFDDVRSGAVDAGFLVGLSGAPANRWEGMRSVTVSTEPAVALVRQWDPLAKADNPALADLSGRAYVHYASGEFLESFQADIQAHLASRGVALGRQVPLDNIDLLTATVEETGAFALMARHVCGYHKRLVPLEIAGLPVFEGRLFYRETSDNPALELFVSAVQAH